jgi:hypothetical protein
MSRSHRRVSLLLAVTVLAVGCGSAAGHGGSPASPASPPSLATSLATASGTWAVAVMGGSAASHNNFWQLFVRPAATGRWRLATPPGVASNGGLVLASPGAGSLVAAFRPSQDLASSPLAISRDNGTTWTPAILDAGLADVPGALAAAPDGRLLALLTNGQAQLSSSGGTVWTRLTTRHALASSPAGRRCGLGSLTAAAFSPSGAPELAGTCTHHGTAGIFTYTGKAWHLAGPALPAAYTHQAITVLRLTTTTAAGTTVALLAAGASPTASVLAAWSTGGVHWALSPPLPLHGAKLTSASFAPGGPAAVVLSGDRGQAITGPAHGWRSLPALPPGTATLAPGATGGWDALAVHRTRLVIWRAGPGARQWASTQTIQVPIQFGSSS